MNAGGRDADKDIPRRQLLPGDQVLLICNPHGKARQVILVLGIKTGHLRGLPADQSRPGLQAALCHALHDLGDLLRHIFPAGNVIQEKQGLSPGAGHIVHAHRHAVNAHRIMLIHQKCQLQLGAHAVRPGQQGGLFHPLKSCHGKCPGESSDSPQHLRPGGLLHVFSHEFYRFVSRFNIYSGFLVIHFLSSTHVPAAGQVPAGISWFSAFRPAPTSSAPYTPYIPVHPASAPFSPRRLSAPRNTPSAALRVPHRRLPGSLPPECPRWLRR